MSSSGPEAHDLAGQTALEATLAAVLEGLPDAVFVHEAATGRILWANPACGGLYGCDPARPESLDLESLCSLEPGFTLADAEVRLAQARAEGAAVFPWRGRRADGTFFWCEVRLTLAGTHVIAVVRDTDAKVRAEAGLARVTRLYTALSLVNQCLTRVRDRRELFESVCRSLVEGGGFFAAWISAPDPATGRFHPLTVVGGEPGWAEGVVVYATDDRPEGRGTMGRAYREGRPMISNDFGVDPVTAPWKEVGRMRGFGAVVSMPLLEDGRVFAVLTLYAREKGFFGPAEMKLLEEVCEDIAFGLANLAREKARLRAEEEREEMEARLQQSRRLESLGTLAGGVAHDMNNVLGAILTLASGERARLEPASPLRRTLDTIQQACVRGREVVQGLLVFARHELGERRPVDLNQLATEIVGLLSHTTLQRIRFALDLDPGLASVEGDPGALNHALMNVCVNAVDAMPGGGAITLRTRNLPGGRVELVVEDTGEGMPEEVIRRAAEPFFTTKPAGKGTGMGLAMVYGTLQAHGGELDIRSEPGRGTRVAFRLPCTGSRPEVPPEAPAAPAVSPARGLRILVVDDDELMRESAEDVLAWQGHQPEGVGGAREALERLDAGEAYDVVILDLNMPGMSGLEALPEILERRPGQRILVASGYTDAPTRARLEGFPRVGTLPKPFSAEELARRLGEILRA
ncbi:MAG TPA: ATP-binding protein [Holophaga sp.]|nr:ATP-binding protein [Holophaga sp.]